MVVFTPSDSTYVNNLEGWQAQSVHQSGIVSQFLFHHACLLLSCFEAISAIVSRRMSALFHHENLLARSYSSPDIRPARVRSLAMSSPPFEPLWGQSHTMTWKQLEDHKARSQSLNARLAELTKRTSDGGTKGPFKVFAFFVLIVETPCHRSLSTLIAHPMAQTQVTRTKN